MPSFELSPAIVQSGFVVLILLVFPLVEAPALRRLKQFTSAPARLSTLRRTILSLWAMALVAVLLAWPKDLFTIRYGNDDMAWLLADPIARTAAIVLAVVFFGLTFGPALQCVFDAKVRQKYGNAMRSLQFMLPVSNTERRWWVLVSITAGFCEEVVFRGFMLQFLQGQSHGGWQLGLTSAWLLSSLAFGCAHLYQGVAGAARTAVAGLLFGLLAILSGSLLLPIVVHILVDLVVLCMYRPQLDNPDAAARLVKGCDPMMAHINAN